MVSGIALGGIFTTAGSFFQKMYKLNMSKMTLQMCHKRDIFLRNVRKQNVSPLDSRNIFAHEISTQSAAQDQLSAFKRNDLVT